MDAAVRPSSGNHLMIAQLLYSSCGAVCRKDYQSFENAGQSKGARRMLHPPELLLTG
jgi:hypothetical protein